MPGGYQGKKDEIQEEFEFSVFVYDALALFLCIWFDYLFKYRVQGERTGLHFHGDFRQIQIHASQIYDGNTTHIQFLIIFICKIHWGKMYSLHAYVTGTLL